MSETSFWQAVSWIGLIEVKFVGPLTTNNSFYHDFCQNLLWFHEVINNAVCFTDTEVKSQSSYMALLRAFHYVCSSHFWLKHSPLKVLHFLR